jgi:hypothetical protein
MDVISDSCFQYQISVSKYLINIHICFLIQDFHRMDFTLYFLESEDLKPQGYNFFLIINHNDKFYRIGM